MTAPAWLSIEQAADHLGVSRRWLERRVAAQTIPHHRLGRLIKFTPGDLAAIETTTAITPPNPRRLRVARTSP